MTTTEQLQALATEIVRARAFIRAAETQVQKCEALMALLNPCDPEAPDGDTSEPPDPAIPTDPTEPEEPSEPEPPHEEEPGPEEPEPDPPGEEPHPDEPEPPTEPDPEEPGGEPHEDPPDEEPEPPEEEEPPPPPEEPHPDPEPPEEPEPDPEPEEPEPPHEEDPEANDPPDAPAVTVDATATTAKVSGSAFSDANEGDEHVYSRFVLVTPDPDPEEEIIVRDTGQIAATTEWTFGDLLPETLGLVARVYYSDGKAWSAAGESAPFNTLAAPNVPPDTPTPTITDVGQHIVIVTGSQFSDPDGP